MSHSTPSGALRTISGISVNIIVATLDGGYSHFVKVVASEKTRILSMGISSSSFPKKLTTSSKVLIVFGNPRNRNTSLDHLLLCCSIVACQVTRNRTYFEGGNCIEVVYISGWEPKEEVPTATESWRARLCHLSYVSCARLHRRVARSLTDRHFQV